MFLFQISNCDAPELDGETAELLRQRLESHSRQTLPGIWKFTDAVNARAAERPVQKKRRVRYRVYGVLLLALGIFLLIPGLMTPKSPELICAGGLAVFAGIIEFCLARQRTSTKIPASCQKEAKTLLEKRRAIDWDKNPVTVSFDDAGMKVHTDTEEEIVPYDKIRSAYEAPHLWLLVHSDEQALLLQKKDLASGQTDEFYPYILQQIGRKG